jgi:RNA polymerase-interacting CarD/CdnL/TRCF family regulator
MDTSIQISKRLQQELLKRKFFDKETYEEVIWDMIEDNEELNAQTKKELAEARAEIKAGKIHTLAKVKKELGL